VETFIRLTESSVNLVLLSLLRFFKPFKLLSKFGGVETFEVGQMPLLHLPLQIIELRL
jgi:hypothetical protein